MTVYMVAAFNNMHCGSCNAGSKDSILCRIGLCLTWHESQGADPTTICSLKSPVLTPTRHPNLKLAVDQVSFSCFLPYFLYTIWKLLKTWGNIRISWSLASEHLPGASESRPREAYVFGWQAGPEVVGGQAPLLIEPLAIHPSSTNKEQMRLN